MKEKFMLKKILQYFLQGLLVISPVLVTFYLLYSLITYFDNLLPIFTYKDAQGNIKVQNYGLGLVIIVGFLILVGYFSYFFISNKLIQYFDKLMSTLPGVKHIYTTTKDFLEAFAGDKKKFTQNVLANVDDNDVWRVGFITNEDMSDFGLKEYVAVYIPMAYSISGNVYIIPKSRVKPITHISSTQTMKFAVSGGITDVDDEENNPDSKEK